MMKFILKTICLSLMFCNFMFGGNGQSKATTSNTGENESTERNLDEEFKKLKEYLGGNPDSDFFVIAITRESKNTLRPAEIELIQLLLSLLLKEQVSEEYTAQVNTIFSNEEKITFDQENVPNYLKTLDIYRKRIEKATEVQDKDKKAFIDILNDMGKEKEKNMLLFSEVSKNPGIIVFNEYFFGQTPFPHDIAENYTKGFSGITPSYLFACNFLTYSHSLSRFTESVIQEHINKFNTTQKATMEKFHHLLKVIPNETESSIILDDTLKQFVLENKTFYAKGNEIISTYNKSSYCQEEDSFLDTNQAFYYFGDWNDLSTDIISPIAQNISTEICRDVIIGKRKGDTELVNFHLIQANGLRRPLPEYVTNLPQKACRYIFCEPSVAKQMAENQEVSHIYINSSDSLNLQKPCYSYFFKLHDNQYDISIYKIQQ